MENTNINILIENYRTSGNQLAFEKVFKLHEKMIYNIIKKVYSIEKEDAYQVACLGFVKAINTFDTNRNVKFDTYAYTIIWNEFKMIFSKENNSKRKAEIISYDEQVCDRDERTSLLDTIIDEDADIINKILINEQHEQLYNLIDKFSKNNQKKKEVIKLMLTDNYIQEDIASRVGVTRSCVSKIFKNFEKYLRKNMIA